MLPHRHFSVPANFGFSSGAIAYVVVPTGKTIAGGSITFNQLRGLRTWEIDSPRSAYLLLEPWMTPRRIRELYLALRGTFGHHIRFGAAAQKTTARAAALYRPFPHCSIITPEKTEQFLAELPIRLLPGLGERTTKFLEAHGVTTFTAFRNVPARTLQTWFGVSGLILKQFAHGLDPRAVAPRAYAAG